eukprot:TRINITY_DN480_c0_g5_i2.p1 TRINITY_DN480_c0_g5~~TRINITY_DN480_c0_g5_i2.p1  ORF type:complete len:780 (-),score=196.98 TRINITY_DN480_c0_g5_i2:93-2381(-)
MTGACMAAGAGRGGSMDDNIRLTQLRAQYDWQLRTKAEEYRGLQGRINMLETQTGEIRASWDVEKRNLVRQVGHYKAVLERYNIPVEEADSLSYEDAGNDGQYSHLFDQKSYGGANGNGTNGNGNTSKGFAGGDQSRAAGKTPGTVELDSKPNTLDSKMRQLGTLIHDSQTHTAQRKQERRAEEEKTTASGARGEGGMAGEHIVPTLRLMFPHATIRAEAPTRPDEQESSGAGERASEAPPGPPPRRSQQQQQQQQQVPPPPPPRNAQQQQQSAQQGSAKADSKNAAAPKKGVKSNLAEPKRFEASSPEEHVTWLEKLSGGHVDDRAMRALQALHLKDAKEALGKVEELVHAQGGTCRNLSSILQSVCKKIEKRAARLGINREEEDEQARLAAAAEARGAAGGGGGGASSSSPGRARIARTEADHSDGGNSEHEAKDALDRSQSHISQASDKRSWADVDDNEEAGNDEDGPRFAMNMSRPDEEHWTNHRIDRLARRCMEIRRRTGPAAGDNWDLKISMSEIKPPLTETGMKRFVEWLEKRIAAFKEEHGAGPLKRCRGEIDFSHNGMTDQMVWILLCALNTMEVHTSLVKFFANNISEAGVLAICEYIRMSASTGVEALHELHLSHNNIEDESALELLRTLHELRPRYPAMRVNDLSGEMAPAPVWVRLNHNRIRDPAEVQRKAEELGITICKAEDRNACGPTKCKEEVCPLVHLYNFTVQSASQRPRGGGRGAAGGASEASGAGDGQKHSAGSDVPGGGMQ